MTTYYEDATVQLHHGDCLDVLRSLPDASVDSVVTDPPYGLEFLGKEWDAPWKQGADVHAEARTMRADEVGDEDKRRYIASSVNKYAAGLPFQQWCELWATECLRVLKPGGHLLAFGGTRTWHRLACAVEDAGFEVRDSIAWLYGSGFPKSLDVSKAIDKRGGADIGWFGPWLREERRRRGISSNHLAKHFLSKTGGETGCVRNWELSLNLPTPDQFNTLCRVLDLPFDEIAEAERTITGQHAAGLGTGDSGVGARGLGKGRRDVPATPDAERWQGWGTALKPAFEPVVVARKPLSGTVASNVLAWGTGALNIDGCRIGGGEPRPARMAAGRSGAVYGAGLEGGLVTEDTVAGRWPANVVLDESQAAELDQMSGDMPSSARTARDNYERGEIGASPARREGDQMGHGDSGGASRFFYVAKADAGERVRVAGVAHPTVKPLALMRWLVRLVTPPGGTVLEPFAGSGTTVEACILEGFHCLAIEREADYLSLIVQRINRRRDPVAAVIAQGDDAGLFDLLDGEPA